MELIILKNFMYWACSGSVFYMFFFVILRMVSPTIRTKLDELDKLAWRTTAIYALFYVIITPIIMWTEYSLMTVHDYELYAEYNRLTGPYAYSFWTPRIIMLVATQYLWIPKLRNSYIARAIFSSLIFYTPIVQRMIMIMVNRNRDYITTSWSASLDLLGLLYQIALSIVCFIMIMGIAHFIKSNLGKKSKHFYARD